MPKIEVERKTASPRMISEVYDLSVGHLANMRSKKIGPRFFRIGHKVLYLVSEFEEWIMQHPVHTIDSLKKER